MSSGCEGDNQHVGRRSGYREVIRVLGFTQGMVVGIWGMAGYLRYLRYSVYGEVLMVWGQWVLRISGGYSGYGGPP